MKKKIVHEYPDAPSGAIFLHDYKEPFMPNETGIGYQGVLAIDAEQDMVQCSLCGWWGENLSLHFRHVHQGYDARIYKEEFGLSPKTALCSEGLRAKYIINGQAMYRKNKNNKRFIAARRKNLRKGRRPGRKHTMERKNKTGTCPEQLLNAIVKLHEELGRRPSQKDFTKKYKGRLTGAINATFGSWNGAVGMIGWKAMKKGERFTYDSWTKENLISALIIFMQKHERVPSRSDSERGLIPSSGSFSKYFNGLKKARAEAIKQGGFSFPIKNYESVNR